MLRRAWLRNVGYVALGLAMGASGWGWVRMLFALDLIMKHERTLSMHAGGLVAHERRMQELESMLGVRYPSGELRTKERITLADLVCSDASLNKRPRFLEVYRRE